MLELDGDLPLTGLLQPLEALFKSVGLLLIEDLEADDLAALAIAGHVEFRHRARNGLAEQLETLAHLEPRLFLAGQRRPKLIEEAHRRADRKEEIRGGSRDCRQ